MNEENGTEIFRGEGLENGNCWPIVADDLILPENTKSVLLQYAKKKKKKKKKKRGFEVGCR